MKRLLIAGLLAVGLLAASQGRSEANGGFGFGVGLGLNFNFTGLHKNQLGSCGNGCCYPPGFSPYYPPPMMYSGFPYCGYPMNYPSFGGYDGAQPVPPLPLGAAPVVPAPIQPPKIEPTPAPTITPLPVGK